MKIISGKYCRYKLFTPSKNSNIRPSYIRAKEVAFNILAHQPKCFNDKCQPAFINGTVADIFAGTGSLGLECLSRGAYSVLFIDNNYEALAIVEKNLKLLNENINQCKQINALFLPMSEIQYDLIFLDPPYYHQLSEKILIRLEKKNWLKLSTIIFLKLPIKEKFNLPKNFQIIEDRICGSARLLFLKLSN